MCKIVKTTLLALMLLSLNAFAQNIPLGRSSHQINVSEDTHETLRVTLRYAELQVNHAENQNGDFSELLLEGACFDGEVGQPKLPVTQQLLEIPFGADVQVRVVNYTTQEYNLADYGVSRLMPVQAPVSKNDMPEGVPFVINEAAYSQDAFIGQKMAEVQVLGTMRGYHIAKLTVAPVTYNPVQNKIQVFNDIDLEISFLHPDMALTNEIKAKTYSPYFDFVKEHFLNQSLERDYPNNPDLTRYPVRYVIVADRMFEGCLDTFINWKTKKGFQVSLAYTDEIGTTYGAIQAYLHGLYNNATPQNPAPSFILFVGDTQQIPAFTGISSQKVTDVYYASVDGDYFPEMYYGRFSAQSVNQLMPQIEKTLYYEQYQFIDPSYLNRATLIAGWDDYWNAMIAQPTVRYGLDYWFNEAHGYTEVYPYFSQDDYEGCYEDDKISVSMINYTAHCSETVWGTPALSASTINGMHNEGFYPVAIGNCCESSQFGYGECVGETWVRADKKGAVCYIGSAPSTYWYEDAWWAMGAYHITNSNLGQVPAYSATTMGSYDAMHEGDYISSGGLVYCGNLAVTEACNHGWSDAARYYWEAYNVLGDPSLVSYHCEGTEMVVTHDPVLFRGFNSFTIQAEPKSYVGITKDGVLLGNGLVGESGSLTLQVTPVNEDGFVEVVVTRPQRIPYHAFVPVATPGQPFLVVTSVTPEVFDYNEETHLTVTVMNVGDQPVPANTLVELQSTDERMEVVNNQCHLDGEVLVGGTATIQDAFVVKAGPEANNNERFRFVTMADCGDAVNADFYVKVNKPVFDFVDFTWSDGFVVGAYFDLYVNFRNIGGCASKDAIGRISTTNPNLSFVQDYSTVGELAPGESVTCTFTVFVTDQVSEDDILEFEVSLEDVGVVETQTITVRNQCVLELELRDSGGNGWEGAYIRMGFSDGTPQMRFELTDGYSETFYIPVNRGVRFVVAWVKGNNDDECSLTLSYKDGEVIYESNGNLHGNLVVATAECAIEPNAITETVSTDPVRVFPNPAKDQLNVVADVEITRCRLMNDLGQMVMDIPAHGTEVQLNTSRFRPGLYLLLLDTPDGMRKKAVLIH